MMLCVLINYTYLFVLLLLTLYSNVIDFELGDKLGLSKTISNTKVKLIVIDFLESCTDQFNVGNILFIVVYSCARASELGVPFISSHHRVSILAS